MKASDLLVKCLEREGVRFIFGVPGEEHADILDSLSRSTIRFIPTRHEQGAALIASVYGRLNGKAGVCLSSPGAGASNLATGVADAEFDHAPLIAITTIDGGKGGFEKKLFAGMTKSQVEIIAPGSIPQGVRSAFDSAQDGLPGAVLLQVSEDAMPRETSAQPFLKKSAREEADGEKINEAVRAINSAALPVMLAGKRAVFAFKELRALAGETGIPVASTICSKGILPEESAESLTVVGLQEKDAELSGFIKADLVVEVGLDDEEFPREKWARGKKIIRIDSAQAKVASGGLEVVGGIGKIAKALSRKLKKRRPLEKSKLKKWAEKELAKASLDDRFPLIPQRIVFDLAKSLFPEDIVVSDVGAHRLWFSRLFPSQKPTAVTTNAFASMGIALPGAIAAKLSFPHRRVVAVTGDGGFLMTASELETAKRLGLGFVVVIFNDCKYGLAEWTQLAKFRKSFGIGFTNPDFAAFAESFGARGKRVKSSGELLPILKKALASNELWVLDVPVDYSENARLFEELGKKICVM